MAIFRSDEYVKKGTGVAFDPTYSPATKVPHSGIYRCEGCGREVTCNKGDPLPPQNHHQHTLMVGPVVWRMIVFTQTDGPGK